MSPVGVTPLAATMSDLATVYLTNSESLAALMTQVDADIEGVAVAPAAAAAPGAVAVDGVVVVDASDGLFGQALSAGAAVVGGAAAQRYAPSGVTFGPDGHPYRAQEASPGAGHSPGVTREAIAAAGAPVGAGGTALGRTAGGRHAASVGRAPGAEPEVPALPGEPPPTPASGRSAHLVPSAYDDGAVPGRGLLPRSPVAGGGADAASAAGRGSGGVPMMGGAGAGDRHDVRDHRLPPWLHESEDVWGEEVVVTSPLIGGTSTGPSLRGPRLL